MKFKENILLNYMSHAPSALAFERFLECQIYEKVSLDTPILDIGCGDGIFASVLFADQIDTGIEPDPKEIEQARIFGAYKELLQCKGDAIPKTDEYYCTIFSNSVLEHIPNLTPVFNEVYRLLAKGGHFYFTVPSHLFEKYTIINQILTYLKLEKLSIWYGRQFNKFWKHYHTHDISGWLSYVQQSGFVVEEAYYYDKKAIAMLNDFLAPFGILGFITKKMTGKWVIFPKIRQALIYPIYLLFRSFLTGHPRSEQGGLVFIMVTKR